jgi:hypothetical protein
LIYSGQLLNDSDQLKDVLRQPDDLKDQVYTIHLIYTQQISPTSDQNQTSENSIDVASENMITDTHMSNSSQNQNHENANVTAQPQMYWPQQYYDPRNNQQLVWMQQAYTHYFTQYMQL